ncbi:ABC transporter permease [Nonomuraea typhae]|uniref:ABC transporter permease n=1 Tax=Nonomuraea typhae TaxID=2603600 RepID=UPI0012F7E9F7|nr:ABC transporter permease [Nonomuraea typhae]
MSRTSHLIRRLLATLVTVYAVVTLNFLLFRVLPGDAVANMSRVPGGSPELTAALRRQFGLDLPLWDQYWIYLGRLAHGDLGVSFATQEPVGDRLAEAFANTLPLVTAGLLLALLIGLVSGALAAWYRGGWVDRLSTNVAIAFYSVPTHFLGLLLILLLGGYLPAQGMRDEFLIDPSGAELMADLVKHMTLPAMTIALIVFGQYTLVVRSSMMETLGDDHVLTARALGAGPVRILARHVLPNAMLPITTLVALSLGGLIGGSILVESVFSWPGVGRAMYEAVVQRDYPMLQGVFLVLTVSVVTLNLLADLLYVRLDPRVAR